MVIQEVKEKIAREELQCFWIKERKMQTGLKLSKIIIIKVHEAYVREAEKERKRIAVRNET